SFVYNKTYLANVIKTQDYLWIDFQYGNTYPRPNEIVDENTLKKRPNPRTPSQFEPNKQLFVLIKFDESTLYISDSKKKKFITDLLIEKIQHDISIKAFYKTVEEFYEQVNKISTICFTSVKRNLFSSKGTIQNALMDNYGMEEPEEFSIQAKFNISIGTKIKNVVNKLLNERSTGKLKKIIIQGLDDQGFSHVFNEGNFINKIEIFADKNSEGLYNYLDIKDKLWDKINE
ncbi:hypothetical protein, partial [Candidatus Proelusimicrobium excrementi]|uniref:hypothetical protein n=1 Tax=Candidatus Proelusimicrobium excrementi TaxID=3416222 RepID=UPI003C95D1B3|nr:hypothetical protein [Elusimicrobiaceae bacterium]